MLRMTLEQYNEFIKKTNNKTISDEKVISEENVKKNIIKKSRKKKEKNIEEINENKTENNDISKDEWQDFLGISNDKNKVVKTKRGVDESVINKSIKNAEIEVKVNDNSLLILFHGARLLSLNEIFAILQIRKYVLFSYKKIWYNKIRDAYYLFSNHKTMFHGKILKVTLYRRGNKLVDNDSLSVMYKFIIDGLRYVNVLEEDNPNIVNEIECIQEIGSHLVGIKLTIQEPKKKTLDNFYNLDDK